MIQFNGSQPGAPPAPAIPDIDIETFPSETFEHLLAELIRPNPNQVRKMFAQNLIDEMIQSVREVGLIHPLRVQKNGDKYDIVDGERRYWSLVALQWKKIPCIVELQAAGEAKTIQKMLIANCQREDLNPIEKAMGYARLMSLCNCSATEAAKKVGTSIGSLTKSLALLRLEDTVQQKIAAGDVPASSGYELARIEDKRLQIELAEQIASGDLQRDAIRSTVTSRVKRQQETNKGAGRSTKRVSAELGSGRTVTFAGADLDLEASIEMAEEYLGQARKARTQGLELATLIKMIADKSRTS